MLEGFRNSSLRSGLFWVHCLRVFACHSASWRFSLARYFELKVEGLAFRCLLISSRTFFQYPFAKIVTEQSTGPGFPIFPLSLSDPSSERWNTLQNEPAIK